MSLKNSSPNGLDKLKHVDPFILTALQNPEDRKILLKFEEEFQKFFSLDDEKISFRPESDYHNLVLHKLCRYYGLLYSFESETKSVLVTKSDQMASSQVWLRNFVPKEEKQITLLKKPKPNEDSPPGDPLDHLSQKNNQVAPMKIQKIEKRPQDSNDQSQPSSGPGSKDGSRGKGSAPPATDPSKAKITGVMKPTRTGPGSETSSPEPQHVNRPKTLEEREEEYAKARARIFKDHPPGSDSDDGSPDQDNDQKKPKKSSSSDDLEVLDPEFKPQDKTRPDEFEKESDVGQPQWNQLFGFHDQMALFSGGPNEPSMFSNGHGPSMHATRSKNSTDRQPTATPDKPAGGATTPGGPSPANGSPRTGGPAGGASPQNDRAQHKREQQDRSPSSQQQSGYPIHLRVLQQGGYPYTNQPGGPNQGNPNSAKNPPSPTQNRTQHSNNYRGSKPPNLSPNQPHVMNPNHVMGPPHGPPPHHLPQPHIQLSPYHYQRPLQLNPQFIPPNARGHHPPGPRGGEHVGGPPQGSFDPNSSKFQPPKGDGFHETPYERFDPHEQFVPYPYTNPGPYGRESPFPGPFAGNSPFIPSPYPGYPPHPYPHDKSMTPIFQQNPPTNFPSGGPNSRGDHSGGDPSKGQKRASHGPPLQQYQPFPPAGPGGAMHYPQHGPISSAPLRMSPYLNMQQDNETSEVSDLMKTNLFIASPPRILSNWNGTQ